MFKLAPSKANEKFLKQMKRDIKERKINSTVKNNDNYFVDDKDEEPQGHDVSEESDAPMTKKSKK